MIARRRLAESLLALLVLLAPLPLGATSPQAMAVIAGLIAVAFILSLPEAAAGGGGMLGRGSALLAIGTLLVVGATLVPWSGTIVRWVAPHVAALRGAVPGAGASPAGALTVDPAATASALAWLVIVAALVAVAFRAGCEPGAARRLVGWLVAGALFQAGYGAFEHLSGRRHVFGYAKRFYLDDATGTFVNKNHYAALLAMALPIVLALLLGLRSLPPSFPPSGAAARWLGREREARGVRMLIGSVVLALLALGLVLSHSRAGVASCAVGCGVIVVASLRRSGVSTVSRALLSGLAAIVLIVALAGAGAALFSPGHWTAGLSGDQGRWPVWKDTLRLAGDFPIAGSGLGSFRAVYPRYRTESGGFVYDHAHNDYLEALAETGLTGAALLGFFLVLFARRVPLAIRNAGAGDRAVALGLAGGAVALALHEAFDFGLHVAGVAVPFAVLAGVLLAFANRKSGGLVVVPELRTHAPDLAPADAAGKGRVHRAGSPVTGSLFPQGSINIVSTTMKRLPAVAIVLAATAVLALEAHRAGTESDPVLASVHAAAADPPASGLRPVFDDAFTRLSRDLRARPCEKDLWLTGLEVALAADALGAADPHGPYTAAVFLDGAVKADPLGGPFRRRLADRLMAGGRREEAFVQFAAALQDRSVDRAELLDAMLAGGFDEERTLEAVGPRPDPLYESAVHFAQTGRARGAESGFRRVVALDRSQARGWVSLCRLVESEGRSDEATTVADEGLAAATGASADERADLLLCRASARAARGDVAGGLEGALGALALAPRLAPARDLAARMKLAGGDAAGAIVEWSFILDQLGADAWTAAHRPGLRLHLGGAYAVLGQRTLALDQYMEALRLAPDDAEIRRAIAGLTGGPAS